MLVVSESQYLFFFSVFPFMDICQILNIFLTGVKTSILSLCMKFLKSILFNTAVTNDNI